MNIYTYHDYVPELPHADLLLDLWKDSWSKLGWDPIVINHSHAKEHPMYNDWIKKFKSLPTVNPKGYELACYLRWLAMAVVGGGWMSDSDVMTYNFKPYTPPTEKLTIWSHGGHICPCLVSGSSEQYTHAAGVFASWEGPTNEEDGRPHASDQNILGKVNYFYDNIPLCSQYGSTAWDAFPIVHYPNGSMEGKQPRHKFIPSLRKF